MKSLTIKIEGNKYFKEENLANIVAGLINLLY